MSTLLTGLNTTPIYSYVGLRICLELCLDLQFDTSLMRSHLIYLMLESIFIYGFGWVEFTSICFGLVNLTFGFKAVVNDKLGYFFELHSDLEDLALIVSFWGEMGCFWFKPWWILKGDFWMFQLVGLVHWNFGWLGKFSKL